MFVNPELFPLICNFSVVHHDTFPVHSMLRFRIQPKHITHSIWKVAKPLSLCQLLESSFEALHPPPAAPTNPDSPEPSPPQDQAPGPGAQKVDPKRKQLWAEHVQRFHKCLDAALMSKASSFSRLLQEWKSDSFFQLWSSTFEDAILGFTGTIGAEQTGP